MTEHDLLQLHCSNSYSNTPPLRDERVFLMPKDDWRTVCQMQLNIAPSERRLQANTKDLIAIS